MALTNIGQGGVTAGSWNVYDNPDSEYGQPGTGSATGSKDTGSVSSYQKPTASTNIGTAYSVVRVATGGTVLFVASNPA